MTEQEIISYLKNSRTSYDFWPDEVRAWAEKHENEEIWEYWAGLWLRTTIPVSFHHIHRLRPDYKPEEVEYEYAEWEGGIVSYMAKSVDGKLYIKVKKK